MHEERVLTGTLNKRKGGEDAVATAMSKTAIPLSPNEAKPHRWAGCGGLRIKRHVAAEKNLKPLKHWASPHRAGWAGCKNPNQTTTQRADLGSTAPKARACRERSRDKRGKHATAPAKQQLSRRLLERRVRLKGQGGAPNKGTRVTLATSLDSTDHSAHQHFHA